MITFAIIYKALQTAWEFVKKYWHAFAVGLGIIILLWVISIGYKSCNRPVKLDQKETEKLVKSLEEGKIKEVRKVLAESDARVESIDANIAEAEKNTREAVKRYDQMTDEEAVAEAIRRLNQ